MKTKNLETKYKKIMSGNFIGEELLKITKEKYPIGCKIIPLNLAYMDKGTEFQVIESLEHIEYSNAKEIWVNTGEFNSRIYSNGIWAEIISTPEVEEIN
jgi:hypothetical protein